MTEIDADLLAEYRGCEPDHDCWPGCRETARHDISEDDEVYPGEFANAQAWAAANRSPA